MAVRDDPLLYQIGKATVANPGKGTQFIMGKRDFPVMVKPQYRCKQQNTIENQTVV
jgi:hypothetical protein